MSLAQMQWKKVSLDEVILVWLRGEKRSRVLPLFSNTPFPRLTWEAGVNKLLDNPDLQNSEENRARIRLLYIFRWIFLVELPPDTLWYRVNNLTDHELSELYAVNIDEWKDPSDNNEILKVGLRKGQQLVCHWSSWEPPILLGHSRTGPFTIIEGNNRISSYIKSASNGLSIPVYIGLSSLKCIWSIFDDLKDRCDCLMQDLIAQK